VAAARKPGPQCAHGNPVAIDDGTLCLAQSPTPGPLGASAILPAKAVAKPVPRMTHTEKMEEAIRRAHDKGQISDAVLAQLPSVKQLVISIVIAAGVLATLGIAAGAVASTGVGAVLEGIAAAIVAALAALGIVASLTQIIAGIKMLAKFFEATRKAQTPQDLDAAGKDFATGLAEVGVGTFMMILSVLGARQSLKMGQGAVGKWKAGRAVPEEPVPSAAKPEPEPKPAPPPMKYPNGIPPEEGARLTQDVRSSLQLKGRNVAVAETNIDGQSQMLTGISGKASPLGSVPTPENPLFTTKPSGAMPRAYDSEVKILESVAKDLPSDAQGTISLYSERPPCLSCEGVIQQFQERFPGIKMIVTHGD
jgi:hypothetical protein